jgi:hypothetical protein
MRSLVVMSMFVASLASASWNGYSETRELELAADGISLLDIDAGAGAIEIRGDSNTTNIQVTATIKIPKLDDDDARKMIESSLTLTLEKRRSKASLEAYFDGDFWHSNDSAKVDLEIRVPRGLAIFVDDGSGSLRIEGVASEIGIDDGSGSIVVTGAESVKVDDGSGSIKIYQTSGDVFIEDGSGDITIRGVGGSVTIDDGSGSIDVDDVEHDVIIVDDGSGSMQLSDIRGAVHRDD